MKVSLILATVGRTHEIGRLLATLGEQVDQNFELIVVDQNSDERLRPYIDEARSLGIQVQHCRREEKNLSAARNFGMSKASGQIVAFPDDDCWYEADTIRGVRSALLDNSDWDALVVQWEEQVISRGNPITAGKLLLTDWRKFRGGDASSISLFFRTDMLRSMGGFDERLGVGQWYGAGEETDLIIRLLTDNWTVTRWPGAKVHHKYSDIDGERTVGTCRSTIRRARGTGAIYAKHRLGLATVLRGLVVPPILAAVSRPSVHSVCLALAKSFGRLQGSVQWLLKETR
jgi:glycosyltransferase involved in cell wall biosynthesis